MHLDGMHLTSVSGTNFYREDDKCSVSIEDVDRVLFG